MKNFLHRIQICLCLCMAVNFAYAQDVNFAWARKWGNVITDQSFSVGVDAIGCVYTTGTFQGPVDFDNGPGIYELTAADQMDAFISKLDAAGSLIWARRIGGTESDAGQSIFVDASSNIYAICNFNGTINFGTGSPIPNMTSTGNTDICVAKLDSAGNFLWVKQIGGTEQDQAYSIVSDASGDVYITGTFNGTVDADPGAGNYGIISAGLADIFIIKLTSVGNFAWAQRFGNVNTDKGTDIAVSNGTVYIAGAVGIAGDNPYLIKLEAATGGLLGTTMFSGGGGGRFTGISVDATGNVYMCGAFNTNLDLDPGPVVFDIFSSGNEDAFVLKLNPAGDFVWAKVIGGTTADAALGIALDATGDVYFTGSFRGTVDFDPGTAVVNRTAVANADIYVCKLSAAGNLLWDKQMGGSGNDVGNNLFVSADGSVHTTGHFFTTVDFDPGAGVNSLQSGGSQDAFIQKMVPVLLPVKMGELTAALAGNRAELSWETFSEHDNAGFEIERSDDGSSFRRMGFVNSRSDGGSSAQIAYSYSDTEPVKAVAYYRLRQLDLNGKATYSNTVRLQYTAGNAGGVQLYPNPAFGQINVITSTSLEDATITLTDIKGQVLSSYRHINGSVFNMALTRYPAGVYFIEVTNNGLTERVKLVKN